MRLKPSAAIIIALVGLMAAQQSLKQIDGLRNTVEDWTRAGLWNNFLTVYANETSREARSLSVRAGASSSNAQSENEFHWRGRVAPGRAVEIKGVNGDVRAESSSSGEVEVIATKQGRRSDPAEVRVQVVEHADGVTVCALYPGPAGSEPNECAPGSGGRMNTRNNDVKVDFMVRVPAGVRFIGRTVNGEVETAALGSDVEAYTVNGGIRISAAGYAQAKTVNGSIVASLGNPNWTKPLEFKTVNGSITLEIPAGTNAELEAETLNGDISMDFPVTVQGRISRKRVSGTIGSGGRELKLKTVNGSIRLPRVAGV